MKVKRNKIIVFLCLSVVFALVFSIAACTEKKDERDIENGIIYDLTEDGSGYAIIGTDKFEETEYTVPETHKGKSVTEIGEKAFKGCKTLTSLTVKNNVKKIGYAAFTNCKNLVKISLPFVGGGDGATDEETLFGYVFGSSSFSGSLEVYQTIGDEDYKFKLPGDLTEVVVTEQKEITEGAFSACENLTEVALIAAESVGKNAFADCDELSVVYVGTSALAKTLTQKNSAGGLLANAGFVYIEENINEVGAYVTDSLELKDGTIEFSGKTFKKYGAHEENGIRYRKDNGEYQVISVSEDFNFETVKVPENINGAKVTKIRTNAFLGEDGIKKIFIPSSMNNIESNAFRGCSSLSSVYIASAEVAKNTLSNSSYGGLIYYAKDVYIASSISDVSAYFTKTFLKKTEKAETVDGVAYDKYYGEEQTIRFEAEYAILDGKNTENGGNTFVRRNAAASNNYYIGNMSNPDNTVTFNIVASSSVRGKLTIRIASLQNPAGNIVCALKNMYVLTVNGGDVAGYDEVMVNPSDAGKAVGGSYSDYVTVEVEIELREGNNVLLFTAGSSINNLDYIEITSMANLTWKPKTDNGIYNDVD